MSVADSAGAGGTSCEQPVISGCVGECGAHFDATFRVEPSDVEGSLGRKLAQFCVQRDPDFVPSLCPNRAAVVLVFVNGRHVYTGKSAPSDGFGGFFLAREGDRVEVMGGLLVGRLPTTECIRLGEEHFEIGLRAR